MSTPNSNQSSQQQKLVFTEEQIHDRARQIWLTQRKRLIEDYRDDAIKELESESRSHPLKRIWQWTGFGEKKLWDFLQLLGVPLVLAIGGFYLQQVAKQNDDIRAQNRAVVERELADDKAYQDTFVKYLDEMAGLLDKGLRKADVDSEAFIIAQAKTVTALRSVDKKRQTLIFQFIDAAKLNDLGKGKEGLLYKARLSRATLQETEINSTNLRGAILRNADLRAANLSDAILSNADLRAANLSDANLIEADLQAADLNGANLSNADVSGVNLRSAILSNANFRKTNLSNADLRAVDLRSANLGNANLSNVDLRAADLRGADLSNTDFSNADFRNADLRDVILVGARLHPVQQLTAQQLTASLLCDVTLPEEITIDRNRDCTRIPDELLKRYPQRFKDLNDAKEYVDTARKAK